LFLLNFLILSTFERYVIYVNWLKFCVRPRAGFDKRSLEWLENIFKQTVGNKGEICREEFKTIVTSKNVGRRHKYFSSLKREILIFLNIIFLELVIFFFPDAIFISASYVLIKQNSCIEFCTVKDELILFIEE